MRRDEQILECLRAAACTVHPRRMELVDLVVEAIGEPAKEPEECWPLNAEAAPSTKRERALFLARAHAVFFPGKSDSILLAAQETAAPGFRFEEITGTGGNWPPPAWFALAALDSNVRGLNGNPVPLVPLEISAEVLGTMLDEWLKELLPVVGVTPDANVKMPSEAKKPRKGVNALMLDEISRNAEAAGWNSREWARHLKCSPSSVVETQAWKSLKGYGARTKSERRKAIRRKLKSNDEYQQRRPE